MMIWGIHVHVGVEDVNKVFPIINALAVYLPHLQALSASSPFWAGERTGYASNRALVFQQLPTAGLPWPLTDWAQFESLSRRHGAHRRDGRRRPRSAGTSGPPPAGARSRCARATACRRCPSSPRSPRSSRCWSSTSRASSTQAREPLPTIQPWFIRENKWRAARYGLRCADDRRQRTGRSARSSTTSARRRATHPDRRGAALRARVRGTRAIVAQGASHARQIAVAEAADGDLREVVQHLIREFRAGPTLRDTWRPLPPESGRASALAEELLDLGEVRRTRLCRRASETEARARRGRTRHRAAGVLGGALRGVARPRPATALAASCRACSTRRACRPSVPCPGMLGTPPRATVFIIFAACSNRCTSWLTSVTVMPDPRAMRRRREPLRSLGLRRSPGVIERMIASVRSISRSSKSSSCSLHLTHTRQHAEHLLHRAHLLHLLKLVEEVLEGELIASRSCRRP